MFGLHEVHHLQLFVYLQFCDTRCTLQICTAVTKVYRIHGLRNTTERFCVSGEILITNFAKCTYAISKFLKHYFGQNDLHLAARTPMSNTKYQIESND